MGVIVTEEQKKQYAEDGYLALGGLLGAGDLQALREEERRFRPEWGYGGSENRTLRVSAQLCARSEPVRRISTTGPQVAVAVDLIGPAVCLTHVQFITKVPGSEETHSDVPWHQDSGYGRLDPPDDLTVFVALTDMDELHGCLQVVPGSHRAGLLEHSMAGVNPVLRETALAGEPVPVPLRAGEALAFSGLLVHGSGANRHEAPRIAYYVRYCAPWVRMVGEGGRSVLEDPHTWMVAGEAPEG